MEESKETKQIQDSVLSFYQELPFNYHDSAEHHVQKIKSQNQILTYNDLDRLLTSSSRKRFSLKSSPDVSQVLEVGCGAGWFTNSLAYYYPAHVKAIDMTEPAVTRAKEVTKALNLEPKVNYIVTDLFSYQDTVSYDLVSSIGVLHHTYDCKGAFLHISQFVKPGKWIYIGLYHLYGRQVFLKHMKTHCEKYGEDSAFELFMAMNSHLDPTHGKSWFRDQVLHPHETQHTLEEVLVWFEEAGFKFYSTSINRFKSINSVEDLIFQEKQLSNYSYQRNVIEKKYYPGFFTMLGQKL